MTKKPRSIRLSDETWEQLEALKVRFDVDSRTKVIEKLVKIHTTLMDNQRPNIVPVPDNETRRIMEEIMEDGFTTRILTPHQRLNNEPWQTEEDIMEDGAPLSFLVFKPIPGVATQSAEPETVPFEPDAIAIFAGPSPSIIETTTDGAPNVWQTIRDIDGDDDFYRPYFYKDNRDTASLSKDK